MPEGPEIHRAARELHDALAGRPATDVFLDFPALKRWEDELRARVVEQVEARGKAMLTRFEGGTTVYSHNQLYGVWQVTAPGDVPPTGRRLRVALQNDERWALLYSATDVTVLRDPVDEATHRYLSRLGPDLCLDTVTAADAIAQLEDRRLSGKRLGGLLLDQGFLAGVGNYLRSEILFLSRVSPDQKPRDLLHEQRVAIAEHAVTLCRRSLESGGVTLPAGEFRAARAAGEPRRTARFYVFARDGLPCRRCGARIRRAEHSGRRVYVCPRCQPPLAR